MNETPRPPEQPPPPEPPPPPEQPLPPPRKPSALAAGWRTALLGSGIAFAIMALLAQGLAFGGVRAQGGGLSTADTFRLGGTYFALFHRVGIDFNVPNVSTGAALGGVVPSSFAISFQATFAMLLGTGLALWFLYRAGRVVADGAGGTLQVRALHGLKVAPLYAALSLGLALLSAFHVALPSNPAVSGTLTIRPSPVGAFLWPLVIAAVAGLAGGVRSGLEAGTGLESWVRRGLGALAGAWRMFLAGLVLSFGGLLVQAVVQPDATSAYFRNAFEEGPAKGAVFIANHVLVLPNQSMFVLVPAMGASDRLSALVSSTTLLSYWRFPESFSSAGTQGVNSLVPSLPEAQGGVAPPPYFLYLLVPLLSALLGGRHAALRGGAASRTEAVWLGAA
ncbi:MAG: hypothetical protein HYU54_02345, partial [Actinobacteria bacterium]|nr:hypothetical protein [Actinomycetota bacterium]